MNPATGETWINRQHWIGRVLSVWKERGGGVVMQGLRDGGSLNAIPLGSFIAEGFYRIDHLCQKGDQP